MMKKMLFSYGNDDGEDIESMWVATVGEPNLYEIANTPFYVPLLACGDVVEGTTGADGELVFRRVVRSGGHSTIRVALLELAAKQVVIERLTALGCQGEVADVEALIAFDIPPSVRWSDVQDVLRELSALGMIDYEEAAISMTHQGT